MLYGNQIKFEKENSGVVGWALLVSAFRSVYTVKPFTRAGFICTDCVTNTNRNCKYYHNQRQRNATRDISKGIQIFKALLKHNYAYLLW